MNTLWSVFGVVIGYLLISISAFMVGPQIFSSKKIFDNMYDVEPKKAKRAILLFFSGIALVIYFSHKGQV